jgi:hypothetical protein
VFLDEHRGALNRCLDGLTEEQVRRSLVPSRTTLLGLVKHVTFVERVWFDEAVTCRSRAEIGIPATPDESFILDDEDTVATILSACSLSGRQRPRRAGVQIAGTQSSIGSRNWPSCTLAAVASTASGRPARSQITWILLPSLPDRPGSGRSDRPPFQPAL